MTPKLSLRDLFALMTIAALALGWWLDHRAQLRALQDSYKKHELLHIHKAVNEAYERQNNRLLKLLAQQREENEQLRNQQAPAAESPVP